MQGSVKAVVCRKHVRYNRKSSKAKRSICKDYTGEVSTWDTHPSCKREEGGERDRMLFCLCDWLTNKISYSQTNEDGCFSTEVNTKIFHRKHGDNYDFNLEAEAFLKESGTGRKN